jgi:hypothetical protein
MKKRLVQTLICWLLPLSISFGGLITTQYTNVNSNSWTVTYTIGNNNLDSIDEFSLYFDYLLYENLAIIMSPADWDALLYQPEPSFPDDGLYDALALSNGIARGEQLTGLTLSFDWLGTDINQMQQYFEIIDPNDFSAIESGYTQNTIVTDVPEPNILFIFVFSLAFLFIRKSKLAKVLLILGVSSTAIQAHAESVAGINASQYQLINKERVGRSSFKFTYEVKFTNTGISYSDVIASVSSDNSAILFSDNEITMPVVIHNSTNQNKDVISFIVDRRKTASLDDLQWSFEGSDNPSETTLQAGRFIDDAVEGLYYTSMSSSGYTDSNGLYMCSENEMVTFFAGNLTLGQTTCQDITTPFTLVDQEPGNDFFDPRAVEILRLLQTVDEDPSNERILISQGSLVYQAPFIDMSIYNESGGIQISIEDLDLPNTKRPLISKQEAIDHFILSRTVASLIKKNFKTIKDNSIHNLNVEIVSERPVVTDDELTILADKYSDHAFLSDRIYDDYEHNLFDIEQSWQLVELVCDINGFKAGLYVKDGVNIIAIGGTGALCSNYSDRGDKLRGIGKDIITDLTLLTNSQSDYSGTISPFDLSTTSPVTVKTPQALSAIYFLNNPKVKTALDNGKVKFITGHSLGGGLANYLGLYSGIETVSFNPAPTPFTNASVSLFVDNNLVGLNVHDNGYLGYDFAHDDKIINIISKADPVSYLAEELLDIQSLSENSLDNADGWNASYKIAKKLLKIPNYMSLEHVRQGESFYLPIDRAGIGANHSIINIMELLQDNKTPLISKYSSSARAKGSYSTEFYEDEADYYIEGLQRYYIPRYKMTVPPYTTVRSEFLVFSENTIPVIGARVYLKINGQPKTQTERHRFFSFEIFDKKEEFLGTATDCQYSYICAKSNSKFGVGLMTDYPFGGNGGDSISGFNGYQRLSTFSNIQGTHTLLLEFEEFQVNVYYDSVLIATETYSSKENAEFSGFRFEITGNGWIEPNIYNNSTNTFLTRNPLVR